MKKKAICYDKTKNSMCCVSFLFVVVVNSVLFNLYGFGSCFRMLAVLVSALLVKSDIKGYTIKHYADNT